MDLKITEEKETSLLSRKEIAADITFKGPTPSKEDVKKQLASSLKSDEKLIVIKNIITSFGSESAKVVAYMYMNEEDMKRIEPKVKEKKEAKPKEDKREEKEAPKKEEPKKEKTEKKEEKKQEPKKEEKKEAPKKQEKK